MMSYKEPEREARGSVSHHGPNGRVNQTRHRAGALLSLSLSPSLPHAILADSLVFLLLENISCCCWYTLCAFSARRPCGFRVRFARFSKVGDPKSSSEKFESPSMDRLCRVSGMSAASIPCPSWTRSDPGSAPNPPGLPGMPVRAPGLVAAAPSHPPLLAPRSRRDALCTHGARAGTACCRWCVVAPRTRPGNTPSSSDPINRQKAHEGVPPRRPSPAPP